jgi:hypothetical protein
MLNSNHERLGEKKKGRHELTKTKKIGNLGWSLVKSDLSSLGKLTHADENTCSTYECPRYQEPNPNRSWCSRFSDGWLLDQ